MTDRRRATNPAGWLGMVGAALLLQACTPPASSGPTSRVFAADMAGGAKSCVVPKVAPVAAQDTPVAVKMGNDGGWCGIVVSNSGRPYSAGLLTTPPAHGKVQIHTVGNDTRIDYTPDRGYAGTDSFNTKLIPSDASLRVSVAVGPT